MLLSYHLYVPSHLGTLSISKSLAILFEPFPYKYSLYILLTIFACSSFIIRFPSSSLSYPKNFLWFTITFPCSNLLLIPQVEFSEIDLLLSSARTERILSKTSPLLSRVLIFSYSNLASMPSSLSSLTTLLVISP